MGGSKRGYLRVTALGARRDGDQLLAHNCSRRLRPSLAFEIVAAFIAVRGGSESIGRVVELADTRDLGSRGEIRAGSSPVAPTNQSPDENPGMRGRSLRPEPRAHFL